jgi:hypothetical protein
MQMNARAMEAITHLFAQRAITPHSLPYLQLLIRRDHIVEDTLIQLSNKLSQSSPLEFKKKLHVSIEIQLFLHI